MRVIHLDEAEAQRLLEACEKAREFLLAAEALTDRSYMDKHGPALERGIHVLRRGLAIPEPEEATT